MPLPLGLLEAIQYAKSLKNTILHDSQYDGNYAVLYVSNDASKSKLYLIYSNNYIVEKDQERIMYDLACIAIEKSLIIHQEKLYTIPITDCNSNIIIGSMCISTDRSYHIHSWISALHKAYHMAYLMFQYD